jgi:hypothetical protein
MPVFSIPEIYSINSRTKLHHWIILAVFVSKTYDIKSWNKENVEQAS